MTPEEVKERLREAAATAYGLPGCSRYAAGYIGTWPQTVQEAIEVWWRYDKVNPPNVRPLPPTPAQIDEMDEAMAWLELIARPRRCWVVLHRSAGWSYPRMRNVTGLSREWLRQHYDKGIDEIVRHLNRHAMKMPKNSTWHLGSERA